MFVIGYFFVEIMHLIFETVNSSVVNIGLNDSIKSLYKTF